MATVKALKAREIRDSRGNPTIELELETSHVKTVASVPSGASVGAHEAHELRDNDKSTGGVTKAISHIHETIGTAIIGKEFNQQDLDTFLCELDGTKNKSRLGGNAILAVSVAFARAEAQERGVALYAYLGSLDNRTTFQLPQPLFNILNGGKHAPHGIDIQECMLAPVGAKNMREQVEVAKKCVMALKALLEQKGYGTEMGDEGGFAPGLTSNDEAFDLLVSAVEKSGHTAEQVKIALDVAASSFYKDGGYVLKAGGQEQVVGEEDMLEWYSAAVEKYPIVSIEDGFAEDDWDGFTALQKQLGEKICIVGDDLTVTNVGRIEMAVEKKAANACIIKPNQIGTVTETIDAVRAARKAGWKIFASHRSGETLDTFISDFAVGLSCEYLKAGAPTKEERVVKYNRLMEIESELRSV